RHRGPRPGGLPLRLPEGATAAGPPGPEGVRRLGDRAFGPPRAPSPLHPTAGPPVPATRAARDRADDPRRPRARGVAPLLPDPDRPDPAPPLRARPPFRRAHGPDRGRRRPRRVAG